MRRHTFGSHKATWVIGKAYQILATIIVLLVIFLK